MTPLPEAEEPLPRKSGAEKPEDMVMPDKGKLMVKQEALIEQMVAEKGSRNSTTSDAEPDREPQPVKGQSPRNPMELSNCSSTELIEQPSLESPGATSCSYARKSATGLVTETEPEEGLVTEADSSMNSFVSGEDEVEVEISTNIEDVLVDYSSVRPGEDGMERMATMLHAIEQGELKRELYICVPDGIGPDRKVTFSFENRSHEVAVPEGYEVGQNVLITLSNRPFLERTAAQAARRGHPQPEFPDRWSIIDNLRHSLRNDADRSTLDTDEFRHRYNMYMLLRGKCGAPLLPFTIEEMPEEVAA